jgi:type IV pilus assembly protein PilV
MVAIAIISVGLLGMAALQATAMKNSYASYQRSLANLQAQDAIDRIWIHRCTLKVGNGLSTILSEWQAAHASASNKVAMPDWSGSIQNVSGSPGSYTITIAWRERSTVQGQEGSTLTYAQTVSVPFVGC